MSAPDNTVLTWQINSPAQMYEIGRAFASSFLRSCAKQENANLGAPVTFSLFAAPFSGKTILTGGCLDGLSGQGDYKNKFDRHVNFYRDLVTQDAITVRGADMGSDLMPSVSELSAGEHPSFEAACLLKRSGLFSENFPGKSGHVYLVEHSTIPPLYATDVVCLIGDPNYDAYSESYFNGLYYYTKTAIATNKGTLTSDAFAEMNIPLTEVHQKKAEILALRLLPQIKEMREQVAGQAREIKKQGKGFQDTGLRLVSFVLLSDYRREPFRNFGAGLLKVAACNF